MQQQKRIPKWLKWEFWPYWFFYIPVYFLIVIHAIRARTFTYFTLTNPGMRMGGFSGYSKYGILRQLQPQYLPKTILFDHPASKEEIIQKMREVRISYPIILKPDEGERGWKVEKISNGLELARYLDDCPESFLLQEYIDLPEEYGVMYYRFPGEKKGYVSSMMQRDFLSVTGNGRSMLLELFGQSERCMYHIERLKEKFRNELTIVLPQGERKVLEEIGNHNRGTTFLDAHQLINEQLVTAFDEASSSLEEWYFGRFDVRASSYEQMVLGNFKVIEVNGANSEPAHIYDPNMSILKAYRDLFHHWNIIFKISMLNRKRGFKAEPAAKVFKGIRAHLKEKEEHPNRIFQPSSSNYAEKPLERN
jgi:hypothetical protein